jgi:hypothetical protein
MHGPVEDPGVYHRALEELFTAINCGETAPEGSNAANNSGSGCISVAMLEVYNEDVRDLLAAQPGAALEISALGAGQMPPGLQPPEDHFLPPLWHVLEIKPYAAACS